ncbi:hypothetical protein QE429_000652 [Bacillus sp. SORGH_AS 510]|nr:hypothetical protein [Bacillus sp. SORGH_AS_0510]
MRDNEYLACGERYCLFFTSFLFVFFKAVLKNNVDYCTLLIGAEDAKTPVGVWFRRDPADACVEEARRNTHGKRSVWSGNQQASLTEPFSKNIWHRCGYPYEYKIKAKRSRLVKQQYH